MVDKRRRIRFEPRTLRPKEPFGYTSLPRSGGQHCTLNGVKVVRVCTNYLWKNPPSDESISTSGLGPGRKKMFVLFCFKAGSCI